MKLVLKMYAVIVLIGFASTSNAQLAPIFSDNFDSENGGVAQLNYAGFSNWTITDGTVDLIGNGSSWDYLPGNGQYIDLDGSTNDSGKMISSLLDLQPGTYTLSFDLAGNHNSGTPADDVTVQIALGSLLNETYTLANDAPFTRFTRTIIVTSPTSASLTFEGSGNDNIGMLLDNVMLSVPEPVTMALLGLGGLFLSKRK